MTKVECLIGAVLALFFLIGVLLVMGVFGSCYYPAGIKSLGYPVQCK